VTIDARRLLLQVEVDDAELERRRARWREPAPRYTRGVLWEFQRLAGSASRGAVTDGDCCSAPPRAGSPGRGRGCHMAGARRRLARGALASGRLELGG